MYIGINSYLSVKNFNLYLGFKLTCNSGNKFGYFVGDKNSSSEIGFGLCLLLELRLIFPFNFRDKKTNLTKNVTINFGGYPTMQFRNGAYLFKPDLNHQPPILPIIDPIDNLKEVVIISGHVFSEISLIYEAGTSVAIQGLHIF